MDFAAAAVHGVVLQSSGDGKEKQQDDPFVPFVHHGGADRDGEHEKMDVERGLAEPFPDLLRGEPRPGQISEPIKNQSEGRRTGVGRGQEAGDHP